MLRDRAGRRTWLWIGVFGILLPAGTYLTVQETVDRAVGRTAQTNLEMLGLDIAALDLDTISPRLAQQLGVRSLVPATEFVVYVISASFCSSNRVPGFLDALAAIPHLVDDQLAGDPRNTLRIAGVAVDASPRAGMEYLLSILDFDEITAGGSWLNVASEKLLFGPYAFPALVPQVVILERQVKWGRSSVALHDERVVIAVSGADAILDWVDRGAPITGIAEGSNPGAEAIRPAACWIEATTSDVGRREGSYPR
jgi:hypothetical protein